MFIFSISPPHSINGPQEDADPLPGQLPDASADTDLFKDHPWIESPIRIDYGTNIRLGKGVFLNYNMVIIDTCVVSIGDRTLVGPNCSIYSGAHPLDPALRNGTAGPEFGKEVHIEEDCWLGGNVTICPGVRVGRGSTIGAGSVVTKVSPSIKSWLLVFPGGTHLRV
jgi:acetyltransferase-like isoleucine patch superfamily enzyme